MPDIQVGLQVFWESLKMQQQAYVQFLCVTLIEKLITEWADTTLAASLCCCKTQSTQNSSMVSRTKTPPIAASDGD